VLSGRGLCDELITRPEESYRLCCVVMCDLETSRIGAPYIHDISNLRVNDSAYRNCFIISSTYYREKSVGRRLTTISKTSLVIYIFSKFVI
jgi:hypothetical protein